MSAARPPYTVEQILEAGLRAQAQGQTEYALQFYQHVTDNFPTSNEARIAREQVTRLTAQRGAEGQTGGPAGGVTPAAQGQTNGFSHNPAMLGPNGPRPGSSPRSQAAGNGSFTPPMAAASPIGLPPNRSPLAPARANDHPLVAGRQSLSEPSLPIPAHNRRYRISGAMALLISSFGVVALVLALALLVLALLPQNTSPLPYPAIVLGAASAGSFVVGMILFVGGQLARAIFDGANATRDLTELVRALAERGPPRP
jgi:hypothetical protein